MYKAFSNFELPTGARQMLNILNVLSCGYLWMTDRIHDIQIEVRRLKVRKVTKNVKVSNDPVDIILQEELKIKKF